MYRRGINVLIIMIMLLFCSKMYVCRYVCMYDHQDDDRNNYRHNLSTVYNSIIKLIIIQRARQIAEINGKQHPQNVGRACTLNILHGILWQCIGRCVMFYGNILNQKLRPLFDDLCKIRQPHSLGNAMRDASFPFHPVQSCAVRVH